MSDGYLTMAEDAGYRGDDARQYAEAIEQQDYEQWMAQQQSEAMLQAQCGDEGHKFYGNEFDPDSVPAEHRDEVGRCYCGTVRYPLDGAA